MIRISAKSLLGLMLFLLLLTSCRTSNVSVAYDWSPAKETWGHHLFNEIVISVPTGLPYVQYRTNRFKFAFEGFIAPNDELIPSDSLTMTIPIDQDSLAHILTERTGYRVLRKAEGLWLYEEVAAFEYDGNSFTLEPSCNVHSSEIGYIRRLPHGRVIQVGFLYSGHKPVLFRDWDPKKLFSEEEYWLVKEIAMSAKD